LLRNRLEFTAQLGGDALVVHPGPFDVSSPTFAAQWGALEESIAEVAPLCEKLRVRLALENMAKFPPPPEFFRLADKFPPSVFGFCLDSGHANIPTADPDLARKMGGRLYALHLHDNHGEKDEHALPGHGTVPWDKVLSAIHSTGYAKPFNFEISLRSANIPADEFLNQAWQTGESFAKKCEGLDLGRV
jgi:sugar phosphate isomerase/epimerase